MDPLSLASSITAMISIADLVVTRAMKYYHSVRDKPKQLKALIEETLALSGVLSALRRAVSQTNTITDVEKTEEDSYKITTSEVTVTTMEPVLLHNCQETLERLQGLLDKMETRSDETMMNAAKRLRWPFMESEINTLLANIERHKSSFQLAISADSLTQIQQLLEGTTDVLADLKDLKTDIQDIAQYQREERADYLRKQREDRNSKILAFLSPADYAANHEIASNLQQEETGKWFMDGEAFQNWLKGDKAFLWVHGIPGAGKTILASMAINRIHSHCRIHDDRAAYFYCDFKDSNLQNPVNVLGSVIGQLAVQEDKIPGCLQALYDKYTEAKAKKKPDLQSLLDVLAEMVEESNESHRTYIVVDGLDECTDRKDFITGLAKLHSRSDLQLSILVTSRDENDIKQAFDGLPTLFITESNIKGDVELYVISEMEKRQRLKEKPDAVKSRIKSALVEGARGMFRWVKCQLDVLCKTRTTKATYAALEDLPIGLDETYERILAKIDDVDFEMASRALTWITCSRRPLKIEELVEAIAISPDQTTVDEEVRLTDPSDIFDICGNLLNATSDTVGLAHYSVKEFLTSIRIKSKPSRISKYAVSVEAGHKELANTCLTYLSFTDFDSGPCMDFEALRERLKEYPLLDYVARYWGMHTELGKVEQDEKWLAKFNEPGSCPLRNILEITSYQDRSEHVIGFEGRYFDDGNEGVLSILVRFHCIALAKKLLERGADVNAHGGRYGNVLQLAANRNDAALVRLLLERGANVNATGGYFKTALQAASIGGDLETMNTLLEYGADVNARGGCLMTALQGAALNGNGDTVKLLLRHGADPNINGGYHGSALRAAALAGYFDIAKTLLEHGADVNAYDKSGQSVLTGAAGSGDEKLVRMLLENGANVNPELPDEMVDGNSRYFTRPLTEAARLGHGHIVRLLLDHGADVNAVDIWTPLSAAVTNGRKDLMDALLANGADINGRWSTYGNPLTTAVRYGQYEMAQALLERGANPNGSGWVTGWDTPLISAVTRGSEKDIRLLVENGADINATGVFSGSALYNAAFTPNMVMVRLLLDLGADVNTPGGLLRSPFLAAVKGGNKDIIQLLLQLGACTTMPDGFGYNLTHHIKYNWCPTLTDPTIILKLDGQSDHEIDLTACNGTILAIFQALKATPTFATAHLFENLGRALLIHGHEFNEDAITCFERLIRRIGEKEDGEEIVFVHTRMCDGCGTDDMIAGQRFVCRVCWDYDLCEVCWRNLGERHGRREGGWEEDKGHEFIETPGNEFGGLAKGTVNKKGETFVEWFEGLEKRFRSRIGVE